MSFRTRFAPSPTGPLHLGHAYSALLAFDMAKAAGGEFLMRIEDIDQSRARPAWEAQIYDDLAWLGLEWPSPVPRQSDRTPDYRDALAQLWTQGLIYPCTCSRRDIAEAASAPQEGGSAITGPDGVIYPGTCRNKTALDRDATLPQDVALRLNMRKALTTLDQTRPMTFVETGAGPNGDTGSIALSRDFLINCVGDIVLSRRDLGTSYHLSVVLDDAAQGITDVVRGNDLFEATKIHVVLQRLLNLPTPTYHHHALIRDAQGKRLAKRDDARAISLYRSEGVMPEEIRKWVGLD